MSDRFIERIDALMEHPEYDPHGDPIPDVRGQITTRGVRPLSAYQVGETFEVARLADDGAAFLQAMKSCGVLPGRSFVVIDRNRDTQIIRIESTENRKDTQTLSLSIAEKVLVLGRSTPVD